MSDVHSGLIEFNLAPSLHRYLIRAFTLGALEGPLGDMKISPNLEPLIDAMNHVLAGGQVAPPTITMPGNTEVVKELKQLLEQANKEANEANKQKKPEEIPMST